MTAAGAQFMSLFFNLQLASQLLSACPFFGHWSHCSQALVFTVPSPHMLAPLPTTFAEHVNPACILQITSYEFCLLKSNDGFAGDCSVHPLQATVAGFAVA